MMSVPAANAADIVIGRVSPLRLGDPGPDGEVLDRIIAAGLRAPDHGQLRPWRFLIIRGEARARFGGLLADSLRRRNPTMPVASIEAECAKPLRAPVIIVAAATIRDTSKSPGIEQVVSTGAAIQNMLIAAHAMGFGGFWRTGAAAYDRDLILALGLAASDQIIGFVYLGSIVTPGKPKFPNPTSVVAEWTGTAAIPS
jgi:nitroreductase